jgi:predicted dienelactone hydrolase
MLSTLIGSTGLLGWLWLDHRRETRLPAPTGSYKVGRVTYDWIDTERLNPYAPDASTKQELAVWLWYPAAVTPSSQPAEYLPAYWRSALEHHQGFLLSRLLSRDLSRVKSHSWSDATVSSRKPPYPLVVLRAGGGALSSDYTSIAEDLASDGYVVVSFDAPYRTVVTAFPDGRVAIRNTQSDFDTMPYKIAEKAATQAMRVWVEDLKFVLGRLRELNANDPTRRFQGKLDLQKIGIVGHSLGGATAAQFCHDDAQCKAGIDIDGIPFGSVVQESLHQPFFFILSDHRKESGQEAVLVKAKMESIYNKLPADTRQQVMIDGANHFSFSDQMFTKSPVMMKALQIVGVIGPLDKHRGIEIADACVRTFFDVYLRDAPASDLSLLPSRYPELHADFTRAFPQNGSAHSNRGVTDGHDPSLNSLERLRSSDSKLRCKRLTG